MTDSGYIKIHRKILDNWVSKRPEYFYAWFLMLTKACWKPQKVVMGNILVELDRGEFITGRRKFARESKLSEKQVRNFFTLLENDKMIVRNKSGRKVGQKWTIITICNYDLYNDPGPREGQQRASSGPHLKKLKKDNKKNTTYPKKFEEPTAEEVEKYAKSIDFTIDGEHFIAHYRQTAKTNGNGEILHWLSKGGTPITSWKQCVVTWKGFEKKRNQEKKTPSATDLVKKYQQ